MNKCKKIIIFILAVVALNLFTNNVWATNNKEVLNVEQFTSALNEAKNNATSSEWYEIKLLSGEYCFNNPISIPSYTKIIADKNTSIDINGDITLNSNSILDFGNGTINYKGSSSKYAIYIKPNVNNVQVSNVNINDGGIYIKQAENINLNNIEMKQPKENAIYAVDSILKDISNVNCNNAQKGIYLKSSKADNIKKCQIVGSTDRGIFMNNSSILGDITGNTIDDFKNTGIELYTGNKINGKIDNNTIKNGNGVGMLLTGPTDKISGSSCGDIEKNIIMNCKGDGIGIYHGSYCGAIINNTLENIGGNHNGKDGDYGIIINSMMKADTYCTKISGNILKNITYAGIAIYSGPAASLDNKYQDTAFVKENIENNTLTNCGTYKPSKDWKNEIANGGKKGCLSAIYVDTHARVKGDICNNTVNTTGEHGIYIHLCSFAKNIYSNTISNTAEVGIEIYHSTVTGDIYDNNIENTGTDGIAGGDKSIVKGEIRNNTIKNNKKCGIYLVDSTVSTIGKNTINNAKKEGIYLNGKSNVTNINNNKITLNNMKTGSAIKSVEKSKIKNIKNNNFNGKMIYGIRVLGIYSNMDINSNTITTSNSSKNAMSPIYLVGNKSYTFNIKNNKVTGNKTNYGIRVKTGKANIINNTVKKTTYPIYIESNKFSVKVQNNVLSSNKKNEVKVAKDKIAIKKVSLSSVKKAKNKKLNLKWKKTNVAQQYEIYQATSKNGTYKKVGTTKKNEYTTKKLIKGKKYFYKICGYKKYGKVTIYTNYSSVKSAKAV